MTGRMVSKYSNLQKVSETRSCLNMGLGSDWMISGWGIRLVGKEIHATENEWTPMEHELSCRGSGDKRDSSVFASMAKLKRTLLMISYCRCDEGRLWQSTAEHEEGVKGMEIMTVGLLGWPSNHCPEIGTGGLTVTSGNLLLRRINQKNTQRSATLLPCLQKRVCERRTGSADLGEMKKQCCVILLMVIGQ